MGFKDLFFKKPKSILTEEDNKILKDIQRNSYMEEAKMIMAIRGRELAKKELELKKEEKNGW